MKRVKIMLIAITAIATVGGALAFNAHKKTKTEFCFTTDSTPGQCTIKTFTALGASGVRVYTTPTILGPDNLKTCPENPDCQPTFTTIE